MIDVRDGTDVCSKTTPFGRSTRCDSVKDGGIVIMSTCHGSWDSEEEEERRDGISAMHVRGASTRAGNCTNCTHGRPGRALSVSMMVCIDYKID